MSTTTGNPPPPVERQPQEPLPAASPPGRWSNRHQEGGIEAGCLPIPLVASRLQQHAMARERLTLSTTTLFPPLIKYHLHSRLYHCSRYFQKPGASYTGHADTFHQNPCVLHSCPCQWRRPLADLSRHVVSPIELRLSQIPLACITVHRAQGRLDCPLAGTHNTMLTYTFKCSISLAFSRKPQADSILDV